MTMANTGSFETLLRAHDLRVTPQRLAVMESVHRLSHPDVDGVYRDLQAIYPTMSLATVYNTLERLETAGIVSSIAVNGRRRFDRRADTHYHAHCEQCGRLQDIDAILDPATELGALAAGWHFRGRSVIWFGVCPTCQRTETHES